MKDSGHPSGRERARRLRAAGTEVERRLWARLRNRRLKGAKFRRQHPIGNYVVDFLCRESCLVVELDGGQHGEERQRRSDERRTEYLESLGYRVLRFWNVEVTDDIEGVLQRIAEGL
jgi:adenine-specific DNA-methyltransferase